MADEEERSKEHTTDDDADENAPRSEEDTADDGDETSDSDASEEGTKPGDWERQPAEKEDLRHDDSAEPLAEPLGDDADDDLAEQQAGDVAAGGDEGFSRPDPPDETEIGDTGSQLEEHAEPLLQGPGVAGVPILSIIGIVAFIAVFCAAFFALWALLDTLGIFLGLIVGTALGLGAMKLLADRQSTAS